MLVTFAVWSTGALNSCPTTDDGVPADDRVHDATMRLIKVRV